MMASNGVQVVDDFARVLEELLERANVVKNTSTVEPPLIKSDFTELIERARSAFPPAHSPDSKKHIVETAVRETFNTLLATTTIDTPSFVKLWNLLDIVSILSDEGQTEPGLLFWLVEELLDSQTIAGCRKVFDYLESRRERITAKDFTSKKLVILRSCNELLRRLSRAEDTAFCGRVFIFLFQSFPLGDKSSVNLRGEYHVENVTTFDVLPSEETPDKMEVDTDPSSQPASTNEKDISNGTNKSSEASPSTKGVSWMEEVMSVDRLYPAFWTLQQYFNQPRKLFEPANLVSFKSGLKETMVMFKAVQQKERIENANKPAKTGEDVKRVTKRKRGQSDDDLANAFNPKYLTSRDLFELEISDLSFRRHISVQVLIVLDFLLSLSTKAKEKLAKATLPDNANKSVMYADQTLSDEDTKWALEMKKLIADYLKQDHEGAFFYRMVETVLSRDKNWARWKIENCPSIAKPAISSEDYVSAKRAAKRTASKRSRQPFRPVGEFDLSFLADGETQSRLDRLKEKSRSQLPSIEGFENKIKSDDLDIEFYQDGDEKKNEAIEAKFSKSWRALRVATATKLVSFDKIDRSDKIDEIFLEQIKPEEPTMNGDTSSQDDDHTMPKDIRPIVISGPSGVGKGTLIKLLLDRHGKVLARKPSHTTRPPREGEVHGQHYFFVSKEEYDMMRDGDQFLEFNNFNGNDYGTSFKVVDGIISQGKVPIMEMDYHGIQQLKDQNYSARFIFLAPPDISELERRLASRGDITPEQVKERLEIAAKELEHAKIEGFHDITFINDDLETTYKALENYIFGTDETTSSEDVIQNGAKGDSEAMDVEVEKVNGSTPLPDSTTDTPVPESVTTSEA